jgi:hypothetical protein
LDEHASAWAGYDVPGVSGLTPFQMLCESTLSCQLERRGIVLTDRRVEGKQERYIRAQLADSCTVWIHTDQIDLAVPGQTEYRLEQWDALTPQEFIEKFTRHLDDVLDILGVVSVSWVTAGETPDVEAAV